MSERVINLPLTDEVIKELHAGDRVLLSGVIYTGRDEAHEFLCEMLEKGEELPVDLKGQVIYYVGPCPAKPGEVIGSCGPTTSTRMDKYAPTIIREMGLKGMIGKGKRSQAVVDAIVENTCVYFAAIGGAGAMISDSVKEAEVVAFHEIGPEAIYRLRVEKYPCTVINDCYGRDLYNEGVEKYRKDK